MKQSDVKFIMNWCVFSLYDTGIYLFILFLVLLFNGMSLSFIVSFINPLSNQQYMNSGSVYPLYWIFHEALTVLRGQKQLQGKEQQSFEL